MNTGSFNQSNAAAVTLDKPLTLIRLFVMMLIGYIKGLPKMVVWTIIRAAVSFLAVLVLHTYFIVVKNEGFSPDPNNPLYRIMNFAGNQTGTLTFWGLATFLLSSLAGRIFFGGPLKLLADFAGTPDFTIKSFKSSAKHAVPVFLAGITSAVFYAVFVKSNYILAIIAIGIFLSFTSGRQGMWFLVLSTALSDFKRLFMKSKKINYGSVAVFILGLLLGMAAAVFIPFKPYGNIFVLLLCVTGIILIARGKVSPRTMMWFGGIFAFQAIILKATGVFADDGGWVEAGGTFSSWWSSQGASTAIGMGIPPSLAGLLGALLGGSGVPKPPPIPDIMDYNVSNWKWKMENGKWVLYQTGEDGTTYGKGLPQSIFEADPEAFGNMVKIYTQPTCNYDNAVDKINDSMDNYGSGYTNNFTMDGWKNLDNNQREIALKALSKQIADAAGVDPDSFTFKLENDPSKGLNGSWSPGSRTLKINPNSNNFDNPLKMIKTLAHELRHAAQGDPKVDLGGGQEYRDLVSWNDKDANYQASGDDFTRYSGQLSERDADAFGRSVSKTLMEKVMQNKYGY